jgi:hypothetical protein
VGERTDLPAPAALQRPLHQALRAIVVDALRVGIGAPLPTNSHYLHTVGASAGTIQRAMTLLAEQDALTVTSHGTRGRIVHTLDVGRAWNIAGLAPLRLLLPPSGPVEIDVLTESLADELTALGLPHTIRHQRGGARRIDAIAAGTVDLAVVSAGVLNAAAQRLHLVQTRVFTPGTYYAPGRLVSVSLTGTGRLPGPGARVAIDPDSPDHVRLTEAAYPRTHGYGYVECAFPDVPAAVLRRDVDLGIWHLSHTVVPLDLAGLRCTELDAPDALAAWRDLSAAALVGSPVHRELASVLAAVRLQALAEAQQHRIREAAAATPCSGTPAG